MPLLAADFKRLERMSQCQRTIAFWVWQDIVIDVDVRDHFGAKGDNLFRIKQCRGHASSVF
jgi:hypothetical protein